MNLSYTKICNSHYVTKNVNVVRLFCDFIPSAKCISNIINPQNLPLLPIPKLKYTLSKFLKSAEPFATSCELSTARDICQKFQRHEGYQIQQLLIQRARESHNWLENYMRYSYLCNREALPMTTSSVLIFPTEKFTSRCDQVNYASRLILGVLQFRKMSLEKRFTLETRERHPLDMEIYKRMFSYTRIPKKDCDDLVHQKESQHIIVIFNNNFFKVRVMNEELQPLSFVQLLSRLEDVLEYGCTKGEPYGILTSMKRDTWSNFFLNMKGMERNSEYLDDIEKALFVVCLDESSPMDIRSYEDKRLSACLNGFHGHGPTINAANRWYDKTLQFFVDPDGSSGIIFEHSAVDATPLGRMADYLASYVRGSKWMNIPFLPLCEKPEQLSFVGNDEIKCAMKVGCKEAQEKSITFSCSVLQYDKYGKEFCKDHVMNPDSIVQIAIQLAHVKAHSQFAPQQEIVSTRKFYLGRNDVVRSSTCEMVQFIKSIDNPLIFLQDRFKALREAARVHQDLSVDAMEGRAIDCHLFGLMMACRDAGRHLPKVFQTKAYLKSSKFKILSMQVPMKSDCFICYPPSCHGGYAVCYNPRSEDFNVCVTCKRNDCDTNSKKLSENWCCAMKKLSDIICGFSRRTKKLCD